MVIPEPKLIVTKLGTNSNEIIFENLGEYATYPKNQYLEIVSEGFTKFICNSLKDGELVRDPIDEFRKTNREFQKIFKRILLFE